MASDDDDKKKYKIGYCKPPKSGQFKPGQSGNPKGKPKGLKNFKTDLAEELATTVTLKENGKTQKMNKQKALIKSIVNGGIGGNVKSQSLTVAAIGKYLSNDGEDPLEQLSEADKEILAQLGQQIQADLTYGCEDDAGEKDDE